MTLGSAAAAQVRLIVLTRARSSVVTPANPSGGSVNWRAEVRCKDFHCRVYSLPGEIGDAPTLHEVAHATIAVGHGLHRRQCIGETQAGRYLRLTVGPVQRPQRIKDGALVFQRRGDHRVARFFQVKAPFSFDLPEGRRLEHIENAGKVRWRTECTRSPEHLPEEQRKILREVALTYRRARRAGKLQDEAVGAAIAEYRRLSPFAAGDRLAVSGEVKPDDRGRDQCQSRGGFWEGPDA